MLNKLSKLIAAGTFVMVVGLSVAGTSLHAKASDTQTGVKSVISRTAGANHRVFNGEYLFSNVHQQKYLTYLVNEFVPETINDWQAAFAERNKVEAAMPKPTPIDIEAIQGLHEDLEISTQIGAIEDGENAFWVPSKTVVIKTLDGMAIADSNNGDFFKAVPMDQQMQDTMNDDVFALPIAEMKEANQLQVDFEQAVVSNDANAIKNLLPKVLADYQKTTQQMADFNEQFKLDMEANGKKE